MSVEKVKCTAVNISKRSTPEEEEFGVSQQALF
jgi:hypothetical protein